METTRYFEYFFQLFGSYRTYEEWKQSNPLLDKTPSAGSYRTYEEWKHASLDRIK